MTNWLALVACYFIGAIPFGVIVGKVTRGIDIREFGSGNIGATNVLRTLGKGPAALVMVSDILKGVAAVVICRWLGLSEWWIVAGGLLSVIGHTLSVFLRFKGGKGVATSLGVIIGLNWVIAAIAFGIWAVIVALTRYVSLASIIATVSVPLMMHYWRWMRIEPVPTAYQVLAAVAATAIVLKHIPNMKRLVNGTEARVGQKVDIDKGGEAQ